MKTILVLDDERAVLSYFRGLLNGYTVLEATSAEEALQQFIQHNRHIDLLIADVILPISSGVQVALLLRSAISELGIVLTASAPLSMWNEQDSADLQRLGSDSMVIVLKPFLPATLLNTVQRFVGPPPTATVSLLSFLTRITERLHK